MSNPHKRKKLARLKALMETKVIKEEVTVPVVVDLVPQELEEVKTIEVLKEESVLTEEVKVVEESQDTLSDIEVKKGKKKKE